MAKKQRGGLSYKEGYKKYKTEHREIKNKIEKLERHVKRFPEDKQAENRLEIIKKERSAAYKRRCKPQTENPVKPQIKTYFHPDIGNSITAGEQLAKLLGLEYSRPGKRSKKPTIHFKTKRNVAKS